MCFRPAAAQVAAASRADFGRFGRRDVADAETSRCPLTCGSGQWGGRDSNLRPTPRDYESVSPSMRVRWLASVRVQLVPARTGVPDSLPFPPPWLHRWPSERTAGWPCGCSRPPKSGVSGGGPASGLAAGQAPGGCGSSPVMRFTLLAPLIGHLSNRDWRDVLDQLSRP
jgi:hypothetical protein